VAAEDPAPAAADPSTQAADEQPAAVPSDTVADASSSQQDAPTAGQTRAQPLLGADGSDANPQITAGTYAAPPAFLRVRAVQRPPRVADDDEPTLFPPARTTDASVSACPLLCLTPRVLPPSVSSQQWDEDNPGWCDAPQPNDAGTLAVYRCRLWNQAPVSRLQLGSS